MKVFLRGRKGDRLGFVFVGIFYTIGGMSTVEAVITSIQGLSASSGDLSALHDLLKGAVDSLRTDSELQLSTLDQLDPSKHSLGYLYLL